MGLTEILGMLKLALSSGFLTQLLVTGIKFFDWWVTRELSKQEHERKQKMTKEEFEKEFQDFLSRRLSSGKEELEQAQDHEDRIDQILTNRNRPL